MSGATQQSATGPASFQQRQLTVIITLGKGTFGQSGTNTATLSGLRVEATVQKGGMPSMDRGEIRVYGVQPSLMNSVSTLGIPIPYARRNNLVTLQAGDPVNGMSTVFFAYLKEAYQDFNNMPETSIQLVGFGGADIAMFPANPISYPSGADVATIMAGLAAQLGLVLENDGVQVQLASPYFPGTALQQIQSCAKAANINAYIDTGTSPAVLAIWPKNSTRSGVVPVISVNTGMIGYPKFRDQGMDFTTVFNPNLRIGGQIQMQSSIGTALQYADPANPTPDTIVAGGPNGTWTIYSLTHTLSSWIPDGPWISEASCARPGLSGQG